MPGFTVRDRNERSRGRATPLARGRAAEDKALRYLEARGLVPVARNYRCPHGELDLVMRDGETLVFVEVRRRTRADYGTAAETVTGRKQARLRAAAAHFLLHHRDHSNRPCRFDIVSFSGDGPEPLWLQDAF
jgi:putative endonuclease